MKRPPAGERRCTYLAVLESDYPAFDDVRELAAYLSNLSVNNFEVVTVDGSLAPEKNRRVLRWVGRHVIARPQHLDGSGFIDPIRVAMDVASCDKVIVADAHVRYSEATLEEISALLDLHEVVEPQDYFDPLPWWGGIEAGRMLVHRSLSQLPDHGSTFGFRRGAIRGLRSLGIPMPDDDVRRLASQGAEVFSAIGIFVRRIPPMLSDWLHDVPRQADDDFDEPAKAAFFFIVLPLALMLAIFGGVRTVSSYAGAIAVASIALAIRGRMGASPFFPWRACFFAPLWVLERSITIYWALLRRMSGGGEPGRIPIAIRPGQRAASGE